MLYFLNNVFLGAFNDISEIMSENYFEKKYLCSRILKRNSFHILGEII